MGPPGAPTDRLPRSASLRLSGKRTRPIERVSANFGSSPGYQPSQPHHSEHLRAPLKTKRTDPQAVRRSLGKAALRPLKEELSFELAELQGRDLSSDLLADVHSAGDRYHRFTH